jgi:hypothetical protein
VLDALDIKSEPPQFSLKPASSFRSTTTQSTASSDEEDSSEKSLPSVV